VVRACLAPYTVGAATRMAPPPTSRRYDSSVPTPNRDDGDDT
jgi:hypothetical protein